MTILSTNRKKTIREAIAFLNINRIPIAVLLEGDATRYDSKIVKVEHGDLISSGVSGRLVIEWLSPQNGKELIQSRNPMRVRFSVGKYGFQFTSYYITDTFEPPYFGHRITYPESLVIVDTRRNKRKIIGTEQPPLFHHARLKIRRSGPRQETYDLRVYDVSEKGVGILVGKELSGLQERVRIGDKLKLELCAPWSMVTVDGTVRHKSRIREGEYSGYYLLGIELAEKLEHYI
jgi:hypothetical protein